MLAWFSAIWILATLAQPWLPAAWQIRPAAAWIWWGAAACQAMAALAYAWVHLLLGRESPAPALVKAAQLAGPNGCNLAEFADLVPGVDHLCERVNRLTAAGHLVHHDGRYRPGRSTLPFVFDLLEAARLLLLGHGSRFLPNAPAGDAPTTAAPHSRWRGIRIAQILWSYSFLRFILVGMLNTLFSFCLYTLLILLGIPYRVALTLMSIAAQFWNFTTTGRLVFGNRRKRLFVKFITVSGTLYLLNLATLSLLVEKLQMGEVLAQAVLTPLVIVVSFLLNRAWVFGRRFELPDTAAR